jgi:hypothetical protein
MRWSRQFLAMAWGMLLGGLGILLIAPLIPEAWPNMLLTVGGAMATIAPLIAMALATIADWIEPPAKL